MRLDLRENTENRVILANLEKNQETDGSAEFSLGATQVKVYITGPAQPKYSRHDNFQECSIDIDFELLPKGKRSASYVENIRKMILKTLTACINVKEYPHSLLVVKILAIRDEGSLYATSLNACMLALLDASIPLNTFACAVCGSYLRNYDGNEMFIIDPTYQEEHIATCTINLVYTGYSLPAQEDDTSSNLSIYSMECEGVFEVEKVNTAAEKLLLFALRIRESIRSTLAAKCGLPN